MKHYIGIDVSKSCLDVHIRPESISMQFTNSVKGIHSLLEVLVNYSFPVVVLEASGGYEKNVKIKLTEKGLETKTLNPTRVREFAKACGKLAKTDEIDAQILRFCEDFYLSHIRVATKLRKAIKDCAVLSNLEKILLKCFILPKKHSI
ncbi:MAG: transposase, partial [Caedimonas sp.]|nr:transposase [Caedimonas sp.]